MNCHLQGQHSSLFPSNLEWGERKFVIPVYPWVRLFQQEAFHPKKKTSVSTCQRVNLNVKISQPWIMLLPAFQRAVSNLFCGTLITTGMKRLRKQRAPVLGRRERHNEVNCNSFNTALTKMAVRNTTRGPHMRTHIQNTLPQACLLAQPLLSSKRKHELVDGYESTSWDYRS